MHILFIFIACKFDSHSAKCNPAIKTLTFYFEELLNDLISQFVYTTHFVYELCRSVHIILVSVI